MTDKKHVITTDAGIDVRVQPISLVTLEMAEQGLLQSYKDRNEPLDVPTYEVEILDGAKEYQPHNPTTLRTDEERAAWKAHIDAKDRYENDLSELRQTIIYADGILDAPADDTWEARQRKRYIKIPDDPDDKRVHWIKTELLKTANDIVEATTAIMTLSAGGIVSREQIDAHKATFLHRLQAPPEVQAGADQGTAGQSDNPE